MNPDRALLLLFPHEYILSDLIESQIDIKSDPDIPLQKLAAQVQQLRSECGQTYLVVVKFRKMQVQLDGAFSFKPTDVILDSGVQLRLEGLASDDPKEPCWEPEKPDFKPIIQSLPEPEVVIGGFHWVDCVFNCFLACEEAGKRTWVAPWITNCGFVHHGLAHLGRDVMDDLPELADFDAFAALLRHYLAIIDYPDE